MFSFVFDVFDTGPRQKEWLRMPRIVAMASGSQNIIRETTRLGPRGRAVASGTAISRIESLLETVIDSITSAEPMSIQVLSRRSVQSRREQALPTRVHFPGRSLHEAQKFARIVLILQLAHDALVSDIVLTKRFVRRTAKFYSLSRKADIGYIPPFISSIFYQHQDLFESQTVVDKLVDDIAITLGLDRSDLNIVSTHVPCKHVAKRVLGSVSQGCCSRPAKYSVSGRRNSGCILRSNGSCAKKSPSRFSSDKGRVL